MRRSNILFDGQYPTPVFAAFLKAIDVPGFDIKSIDEELQMRFFQKDSSGQPRERWDLNAVETTCPPNQFMRHLAACGFVLKTEPEQKRYTRAAWPGALMTRAMARLADLIEVWKKGVRWEEIIVFGGKRPLVPEKEGIAQYCQITGSRQEDPTGQRYARLWEEITPQTELEMMDFLWQASYLPTDLRTLPITFVDAPMKPPLKEGGPPVRPNTEDTIVEWLKGNPTPGYILLSSGAPYGMAQDEAVAMLLEPDGHDVETFGHAAPDLAPEVFMREVAGTVNRIRRARGL